MKRIASISVAVLLGASMAAQANLIDLGEGPQGPNSNPDTEEGLAEGIIGVDLDFLYRFPTGEGTFDSYFTVVDNGDGTADVSWDLTGADKELWAVAVKTGSTSIHWYGVTDDQKLTSGGVQIVVAPNNPNNGRPFDSISHLSFFGSDPQPTTPPNLPDAGSTSLLLGLGVLGLFSVHRRK